MDSVSTEELAIGYYLPVFQSVANVAEYREPDAKGHLKRVSIYARYIAERVLGWSEMDAYRLEIAALLHDVGKVAISRGELWLRPNRLNREERRYIQKHTIRGHEIVSDMEQHFLFMPWYDAALFTFAKQVTRHHHENYDGSGYPDGLAGEAISQSARILKLADVVDALLSRRPYKEAWTWEQARTELTETAHREFDPELVKRFLQFDSDFLELVATQTMTRRMEI